MSETTATFRRPRAWVTFTTFVVILVSYFAVRAVFEPGSFAGDYPFGVAMVLGLLWALFHTAGQRQSGLAVDEAGITELKTQVNLPWPAIREVRVDEEPVGRQTARVITLLGDGESVSFIDAAAQVSTIGPAPVDNAPALLAVVAARTGSADLFPAEWRAAQPEPVADSRTPNATRTPGVGLVALLFKAGPKALKMGLKLLKTVKPGAAILAVGAYSLVFSWRFALVVVLHVLIHELGHVFAMFRSGVPVRGVYLIPFFGGAAVSRGVARTRAKSAYIAINGPVWGTLLSVALGAAHFALDGAHPILGAAAAWGALINLFNLLPIFPLDGGRILASLALSSERGLGAPALYASLALGAGLAYVAHLELLVLMVLLGLLELGGALSARTLRPALALMAPRDLDGPAFAHFAGLVLPSTVKGRDKVVAQRVTAFEQQKQEALQTPMTVGQGLAVFAGYGALVAVLLGLLFLTRDLEGAGDPLGFLR